MVEGAVAVVKVGLEVLAALEGAAKALNKADKVVL